MATRWLGVATLSVELSSSGIWKDIAPQALVQALKKSIDWPLSQTMWFSDHDHMTYFLSKTNLYFVLTICDWMEAVDHVTELLVEDP